MAESVLENSAALLPFVGVLTLVVTYMAVKAGFYRPLSAASYSRTPTFGDVLFVFSLYLTYSTLFPFALYFALLILQKVFPGMHSENANLWVACLNLWLTLPVASYLCHEMKPSALRSVMESDTSKTKNDVWYNLSVGAITWFICYPGVILLTLFLSGVLEALFHPPETDQVAVKFLKKTFNDPTLSACFLSGVVFAVPMIEEFLFRGILQRYLIPKMGLLAGILMTSVGFSGMHYSATQGMYNLELLPALFVLSCYLGYLYERQRSLWAPIGLHMTFNLISSMMLIFKG